MNKVTSFTHIETDDSPIDTVRREEDTNEGVVPVQQATDALNQVIEQLKETQGETQANMMRTFAVCTLLKSAAENQPGDTIIPYEREAGEALLRMMATNEREVLEYVNSRKRAAVWFLSGTFDPTVSSDEQIKRVRLLGLKPPDAVDKDSLPRSFLSEIKERKIPLRVGATESVRDSIAQYCREVVDQHPEVSRVAQCSVFIEGVRTYRSNMQKSLVEEGGFRKKDISMILSLYDNRLFDELKIKPEYPQVFQELFD